MVQSFRALKYFHVFMTNESAPLWNDSGVGMTESDTMLIQIQRHGVRGELVITMMIII